MTSGPAASALPGALPPESGWQDLPQPRMGYSTQRLQPVVLGPPPDPSFRDVSADDDLDPDDLRPRHRPGVVVGVVALLLVLVTAGTAYVWLKAQDPTVAALPPSPPAVVLPPAESPQITRPPAADIPASQTLATPVPALPVDPPAPAPATVAPVLPPQAPSENPEMGGVQTELVPPATDGLSPARRVQTIRIVVENDRELANPR